VVVLNKLLGYANGHKLAVLVGLHKKTPVVGIDLGFYQDNIGDC
jgi:hypothetical protein